MNIYRSSVAFRLPDGTDVARNQEFTRLPSEHLSQLIESRMIVLVGTAASESSPADNTEADLFTAPTAAASKPAKKAPSQAEDSAS